MVMEYGPNMYSESPVVNVLSEGVAGVNMCCRSVCDTTGRFFG